MPISRYVAGLRRRVGNDLLMLPGATAVVMDGAGRLLLGQRADNGRWALPGGGVDPGEQPAEAVVREVYEETGVHVTVERLAGVVLRQSSYANGDVCQYMSVWFRCRATGGTARVNDEESLAVGWYHLDDLPGELDAFDRLRIDTALDDSAPAWFARPGQSYGWLPRPVPPG
jgi:8-oxo-dGTP diphosphatase